MVNHNEKPDGKTYINELEIEGALTLKGDIYTDTSAIAANATNNVTISNVAPAAVGTATISQWLTVYVNGTAYYIPMWT